MILSISSIGGNITIKRNTIRSIAMDWKIYNNNNNDKKGRMAIRKLET